MVTLKHIAEKAGFTVSVVSRALNPRPDRHARVAPDTKARIEEVARELGFRRNRGAEFLKRGKSPVIQIFLPGKAYSQTADLMFGMAEAAAKEDFPLSFSFGITENSYSHFLQSAIRNRSCGVLAVQPVMAPGFWSRFEPAIDSLKMLSLNARSASPGHVPVLSIGYQEAGSLAADHLVARGCARLAVIGRAPQRILGFQGSARLKATPVHCFQPSETTALASWIREAAKPVGIFALTDILALKVIRHVQRLGLRVPEDVRIVGHDDSEFAVHLDPALTTIRQPYREQGREAVRMIIRMMYGETVDSKIIQPALIVRESA